MSTRHLGSTGPATVPLGLGCMGMSAAYGPSDRDESVATVHAALDAGVTVLDTGDFYGMGENELILHEALKGRPREEYLLSVKFGVQRDPAGAHLGIDGSPSAVKTALAYSLRRLGTDYVDIYRPARLDPRVPIEETVGAVKELVEAGYVRHIGLSEVGAETIRRAHAVHPIADLQIEYSLFSRGVERAILPTLRELGIGMTAYGVLARGLLGGHWKKSGGANAADFRARSPRFQGENLDHNLELVEALRKVADGLGSTVAKVAIAWVAAQDELIVPLAGARTRERLAEAVGSLDLKLDAAQVAAIEAAVPAEQVRGERYVASQMASLDSEK